VSTDTSADTLDKVYSDYEADPAFQHLKAGATRLVKGVGPTDPLAVFIGEAPGKNEDEKGVPFVGRAGKYFDELLESIGVVRGDVFITNIVKYRPKDNRDPTYGEIATSKAYLDRELAVLNCKIIVPMGKHALSVFFPSQLRDAHGRVSEQANGTFVVPQYHPAIGGIYNRKVYDPIMKNDFQNIGILMDALYKDKGM
jgi:uracil-DNA glycosylase family 4